MAFALLPGGTGPAQAQTRQPPYWASISAGEARMRVGPSLDYPSNWVYRRRDLPVKVVQIHGNWRKIADESGTQGWMHVRLLSDTPTAMIAVPEGHVHKSAKDGSPLLYRMEKGVVGRVSDCSRDWCQFDIGGGKKGYIHASSLWGAVR
ncbi:MAG: SH3 domain-containing protein [Sphingobium sp.]